MLASCFLTNRINAEMPREARCLINWSKYIAITLLVVSIICFVGSVLFYTGQFNVGAVTQAAALYLMIGGIVLLVASCVAWFVRHRTFSEMHRINEELRSDTTMITEIHDEEAQRQEDNEPIARAEVARFLAPDN